MTDVDHRAFSAISKLEMKTTRKSLVTIFDKSTDNPDGSKQSVIMGNLGQSYAQNCAKETHTGFVRNIEKEPNHNISKRKVKTRNDKSSLLIHEKSVETATEKIYDQIDPNCNANDQNYKLNQNKLLESLNADQISRSSLSET